MAADGFDAMHKRLYAKENEWRLKAQAAVLSGTECALSCARENAPVDTGRLKSGIEAEFRTDGEGAAARVRSAAPYSIYVELGTGTARAQPFLRPAFFAGRTQILRALKEAKK